MSFVTNDSNTQAMKFASFLVKDGNAIGASDKEQASRIIEAYQIRPACQAHRIRISRNNPHCAQVDAHKILEKPRLWIEVSTSKKRDVLNAIDSHAMWSTAVGW